MAACTLITDSGRPVPGEERNLRCGLEYRPDPDHDGPDLLFFAVASPYRTEEAYMNPLEGIVHGIWAPGRHLSAPVDVRGAVCEAPWRKGHRVPMTVGRSHHLLCRRQGIAEVRIQVQTKWGECEQVVAEGDRTPRCRPWFDRPSHGLRFLSQDVCTESEYERMPNGQWRVRPTPTRENASSR